MPRGGFISLGGTAARYLDLLTGNEVSRRSRDNSLRGLNDEEISNRERSSLRTRTGSIARDYMVAQRLDDIRGSNRNTFINIRDTLRDRTLVGSDRQAQALITIGRRKPDSDFPVGETPK